jgi:hypothetical protein
MRKFKRKHGFLTFAQNNDKDDYLKLAYALGLSIRATQTVGPYLSVVVTPKTKIPKHYIKIFDEIIDVPWIDEAKNSEWKLENEWKSYHITPYEETIKLDADMLFTTDIKDWWPLLALQDITMCDTVETYRGEVIESDFYRKVFTQNDLPNVYTGMMYFKVNDKSEEFFNLTQMIYHNWQRYFEEFLEPVNRPTFVSTDVVFALAAKILGEDEYTSSYPVPRFVHMKSRLQGWPEIIEEDADWMKHVSITLTDDLILKIGRQTQTMPFHYHNKTFVDEFIQMYEKKLGIKI